MLFLPTNLIWINLNSNASQENTLLSRLTFKKVFGEHPHIFKSRVLFNDRYWDHISKEKTLVTKDWQLSPRCVNLTQQVTWSHLLSYSNYLE